MERNELEKYTWEYSFEKCNLTVVGVGRIWVFSPRVLLETPNVGEKYPGWI